MGYSRIMQGVADQTAMRAMAWNAFDDRWYGSLGIDTTAGIDVNEVIAMTHPVFWACVKVVAETLSTLPLHVYERVDENTRENVDHPLNDLFSSKANRDATGITVRESDGVNELVWGASFHEVVWNNREDEPREIIPLQAAHFDPIERNARGELVFWYKEPGMQRRLIPNDRMWYSPGLSLNGITGMSVVAYHRETVGLGLAARKFRAALFGNNCQIGGMIESREGGPPLSDPAAKRLLQSLKEHHQGSGNAFKWGILRDGMTFKQYDMPDEDALFLALERPSRVDMCGMFRVPPVYVGDDERATYHNTEQQGIQLATHCIQPCCVRREASIRRRFFPDTKLYVRHNMAALVRGDFATRMDAYNIGLQYGLWSIDEVRALEEMNPLPDGLGTTRYRPLNLGIVGEEPPIRQIGGEQALAAVGNLSHSIRETLAEQRTAMIGRDVRWKQEMQQREEAHRRQGRRVVKAVRSVDRSLTDLRQTTIEVGDRQATATGRIAEQVTDLASNLVRPVIDTFQPMIAESAKRVGRKEGKALLAAFRKRGAESTPDGFGEWLANFYRGHAAWIAETFEPIFAGYEEAARRAVRPTASEFAAEYCRLHQEAVLAGLNEDSAELARQLETWGETAAANLAAQITKVLCDTKDTPDA